MRKCAHLKNCPCTKVTCENHGVCCNCVVKHKNSDSLPYCLFLDNEGDKSIKNYYAKLKTRFEGKEEENLK